MTLPDPALFLGSLAGFATARLLVWAVWRYLLWSTARAERDPYFCREYARPKPSTRSGADSSCVSATATLNATKTRSPEVEPFSRYVTTSRPGAVIHVEEHRLSGDERKALDFGHSPFAPRGDR